ncbi:PLP-dependent aspartate aminotransferase family protein [Streptomyces mirabilis]|uniref:Aminotransferase class I/II-fold pyridoxal phosphate-dependent enzyme n=1 Tax=Streptomyces mirabilis TaxID=68239 RepID=A0ABU3V5Y5_9ACTN|nr:aminotransferase class I/II-fold pyridoxal phosphate-dependent enzyme [Streptomyces mirabilis]MCX5357042.1 aminotransferase class I/II-fold pyridoxal phosphate-dependent enzyme [Streptomyces mirabilis]MDU9001579.1 aminotransferase class I/II-fold pyridoxal phosphate-dependent enzyme [Streptomyces mirabilis]
MSQGNRTAIGFDEGVAPEASWFNDLTRKRSAGPVSPHNRVLPRNTSPDTLAVHAGTYEDPTTGSVGTPIFQSSTFLLDDTSYTAFSDGTLRDVPIYTRYGNPSQWSAQEKVASLEGAESGLVTASGMSAIANTVYALTNAGSHVISAYDVYGGTYNLLREDLPSAGRTVSFVDPMDISAIEAAVRPETQLLLFESLTNPMLKAPNIRALVRIAKEANALLAIDNTFLTPINMKPLDLGVDIVIHSATKYLGGHSDLTAGAVVGRRKYLDRIWAQTLRFGGTLDPFCCFLLERGMKTLSLRVKKQNENATAIAQALAGHPHVRNIFHPVAGGSQYTSLDTTDYGGFGGMVSFEVDGGDDAAEKFMRRLRIPYVATSLGGVESLVSMPSNTSHSSLTEKQLSSVGINPGLVRYSAGIEDSQDLIDDLFNALEGREKQ